MPSWPQSGVKSRVVLHVHVVPTQSCPYVPQMPDEHSSSLKHGVVFARSGWHV